MAETRAGADRAFDGWIERYEDKYPKAADCLKNGRRIPSRHTNISSHRQEDNLARALSRLLACVTKPALGDAQKLRRRFSTLSLQLAVPTARSRR